MEDLELVCFKIISNVGSAKSYYLEALAEAKQANYEKAKDLIKQGNELFVLGHKVHHELIANEASGNKTEFSLLLMHAEDQLMNAETIKVLAQELIEVYETIRK